MFSLLQYVVTAIRYSQFSAHIIILFSGEFGDVYKGILKTDNIGDIEVAVKTLKVEFLNLLRISLSM
jgi:hypothetical protein